MDVNARKGEGVRSGRQGRITLHLRTNTHWPEWNSARILGEGLSLVAALRADKCFSTPSMLSSRSRPGEARPEGCHQGSRELGQDRTLAQSSILRAARV